MLVSNQTDAGLVRLYGYGDQASAMRAMDQACAEVTMQDPLGAYLVDYVTYDCVESAGCYEITVKIAYQKTPAQLRALVNATTTGALQELLETALREEKTELAVKIGYMDRSAEEVSAQVAQLMEEKGLAAEDCSIRYYPDEGEVGDTRIVEITWQPLAPPLPGALTGRRIFRRTLFPGEQNASRKLAAGVLFLYGSGGKIYFVPCIAGNQPVQRPMALHHHTAVHAGRGGHVADVVREKQIFHKAQRPQEHQKRLILPNELYMRLLRGLIVGKIGGFFSKEKSEKRA